MKPTHLISTDTFQEAQKIAQEKKLQPEDWKYITPIHPRRGFDLEKFGFGIPDMILIGRFTAFEKEQLGK